MPHIILSRKYLTKDNFNKQHKNHSSDSQFKDFIKLCKDYTKESFSFLVKNTILPPENPLRFKKIPL